MISLKYRICIIRILTNNSNNIMVHASMTTLVAKQFSRFRRAARRAILNSNKHWGLYCPAVDNGTQGQPQLETSEGCRRLAGQYGYKTSAEYSREVIAPLIWNTVFFSPTVAILDLGLWLPPPPS